MSILMNFGSESFHQDELLANENDVMRALKMTMMRARKSAVRITSGVVMIH